MPEVAIVQPCICHHHDWLHGRSLITLRDCREGTVLPLSPGRQIRNLAGAATYIVSHMQTYAGGSLAHSHRFCVDPKMRGLSADPTGPHPPAMWNWLNEGAVTACSLCGVPGGAQS